MESVYIIALWLTEVRHDVFGASLEYLKKNVKFFFLDIGTKHPHWSGSLSLMINVTFQHGLMRFIYLWKCLNFESNDSKWNTWNKTNGSHRSSQEDRRKWCEIIN